MQDSSLYEKVLNKVLVLLFIIVIVDVVIIIFIIIIIIKGIAIYNNYCFLLLLRRISISKWCCGLSRRFWRHFFVYASIQLVLLLISSFLVCYLFVYLFPLISQDRIF